MGLDLDLDAHVEAVEDAPDAGSAYDALLALFNAGAVSTRTPFGAAAKQAATVVEIPAGTITRWAGGAAAVPDGWLPCNGQSVAKADHADLFAAIGTTFGGSGANFNLPDTRRRVTIGAGGTRPPGSLGPGTAMGDTGGHETASITVGQMARHGHGIDLSLSIAGKHRHQVYQTWTAGVESNTQRLSAGVSGAAGTLDTSGAHTHAITGDTADAGSASPTAVTLASKTVVMTHIIKT